MQIGEWNASENKNVFVFCVQFRVGRDNCSHDSLVRIDGNSRVTRKYDVDSQWTCISI